MTSGINSFLKGIPECLCGFTGSWSSTAGFRLTSSRMVASRPTSRLPRRHIKCSHSSSPWPQNCVPTNTSRSPAGMLTWLLFLQSGRTFLNSLGGCQSPMMMNFTDLFHLLTLSSHSCRVSMSSIVLQLTWSVLSMNSYNWLDILLVIFYGIAPQALRSETGVQMCVSLCTKMRVEVGEKKEMSFWMEEAWGTSQSSKTEMVLLLIEHSPCDDCGNRRQSLSLIL